MSHTAHHFNVTTTNHVHEYHITPLSTTPHPQHITSLHYSTLQYTTSAQSAAEEAEDTQELAGSGAACVCYLVSPDNRRTNALILPYLLIAISSPLSHHCLRVIVSPSILLNHHFTHCFITTSLLPRFCFITMFSSSLTHHCFFAIASPLP
jgi:hypothetical protein